MLRHCTVPNDIRYLNIILHVSISEELHANKSAEHIANTQAKS